MTVKIFNHEKFRYIRWVKVSNYKKYVCTTSDKTRGLKKVAKAKLFQVSNSFHGTIYLPKPKIVKSTLKQMYA